MTIFKLIEQVAKERVDQDIKETRFIVDKVEFDKLAGEKLARIANPGKWRASYSNQPSARDNLHANHPRRVCRFDRGNHLFLCQLFPYTIQSQLTFRRFHAGFERRIERSLEILTQRIEPSEEILLFGT